MITAFPQLVKTELFIQNKTNILNFLAWGDKKQPKMAAKDLYNYEGRQ